MELPILREGSNVAGFEVLPRYRMVEGLVKRAVHKWSVVM